MNNNLTYVEIALGLYRDQLVAHGLYFFASIAALITYLALIANLKRSYQNNRAYRILSIGGSTLLFFLVIYSTFRIVLYGQLVYAIENYAFDPTESYDTLGKFVYVAWHSSHYSKLPTALLLSEWKLRVFVSLISAYLLSRIFVGLVNKLKLKRYEKSKV